MKRLAGIILTGVLAVSPANSKADMIHDLGFYNKSTTIYRYDGINIKPGNLTPTDILEIGVDYTFGTKIESLGTEPSSSDLSAWITGPETFYWDSDPPKSITDLEPTDSPRTRTKTFNFSIPGRYTFNSEILQSDDNLANNTASRSFTVIPEPSTSGLLALGGLAISRRRRK